MPDAAKLHVDLQGVEETLLIPLLARARETRRWNGIVRDARAVEVVDRLDYDFSKLALTAATQASVAVRTDILDEATRAFLARHPDALVINLAAGLDTRFYRVDNGRLSWVDVDLPEAMAIRRQVFTDTDRHRYLAGSVLEDAWCAQIERSAGQAVLIVIEGLVMYFTPEETRELLIRLARYFPGAEVLMEVVSPLAVTQSARHFEERGMSARWKGGLADGREVEAWDPRLRFHEAWRYYDRHPLRWGVWAIARWIPGFKDFFQILHVAIGP